MAAAARLRSPASNITVKTGFTACAETGAMNDQTVTAPGLRRLAERERFLAFAFTAADILLEVDAERRIVFAAGAAVKFRLGVPAEALLGRIWLAGGHDAALIADLLATPRPVFPLEGRDVLALGIPPGRAVGEALRQVRGWWLAQGCPDDAEACRAVLETVARGG